MKKFLALALAALVAMPTVTMAQKTTVQRVTREKTYETQKTDVSIWYQGELSFGFATGSNLTYKSEGVSSKQKTDLSRPFIETVHGVRITQYAFVGLGLGVQYAYGKMNPDYNESENWGALLMPIFVNLKGYYPVSDNFAPYVTVSLGGTASLTSNIDDSGYEYYYGNWEEKLTGGFYSKVGLGLSYRKFMFDFGLMHQNMGFKYTIDGTSEKEKASTNAFYVNLGFKF